jgi:uncharacterized protein
MRNLLQGAAAVALVAGFGTVASAADIRLMTGPQGGSWYPLGGAMKNMVENAMPEHSVQVLPGAGIANIKGIESGRADVAFGNSVSTVDAIAGNDPFEEAATNTCNVATLYPQYFQAVALADAGIKTPADLAGKSLTTQPRGNTGEQITRNMLEAAGLSYDDLSEVSLMSYTDSVNLLRDGNAQVFTLGTTVPAGSIMDLMSARDINFIEIAGEHFEKIKEINPGYQQLTIEAGTYPGIDEDVTTIGYATHIIARCDLEEDVVYGLVKAMHENVDDMAAIANAMEGMTPELMASETGVPLHPGAERYYEEQGVM